jgi:amino acid transporter
MSYGIRLVVGDGASEDGNPFTLMTVKAELQWTAGLVYFGALISAFACALASVNAASRLMFSMSRYGVIRASLGKVHPTYKTPYAAVILITIIASAIALITLPAGLIQGYTWTATVTAFGFLSIYAMVCIAAPIESWKRRELGVAGVVMAALGLGLIVFVVVGTLYPVPEYPMNLLPLIFMGYVGAGLAWCLVLRRNAPDVLRDLRKDMES